MPQLILTNSSVESVTTTFSDTIFTKDGFQAQGTHGAADALQSVQELIKIRRRRTEQLGGSGPQRLASAARPTKPHPSQPHQPGLRGAPSVALPAALDKGGIVQPALAAVCAAWSPVFTAGPLLGFSARPPSPPPTPFPPRPPFCRGKCPKHHQDPLFHTFCRARTAHGLNIKHWMFGLPKGVATLPRSGSDPRTNISRHSQHISTAFTLMFRVGARAEASGGDNVFLAVGTLGGVLWLWQLQLPNSYTMSSSAPYPVLRLVRFTTAGSLANMVSSRVAMLPCETMRAYGLDPQLPFSGL